jgi:rhodanese-related sulfurtransferase
MATSTDQAVFKKPVQFSLVEANPENGMVRDVAPEEVIRHKENLIFVDVRTPEEFVGELGHIDGARLFTLPTLPDHIDSLPKTASIVFVCRSGARSARATAFALQSGFEHVFNMKGGMLRWNELSLPTAL